MEGNDCPFSFEAFGLYKLCDPDESGRVLKISMVDGFEAGVNDIDHADAVLYDEIHEAVHALYVDLNHGDHDLDLGEVHAL
eukprot:426532-Lingulodinium_polyedra.AAC.1